MNRFGQHSGWVRGLDLLGFDRGRARRRKARRPDPGSWVEFLEDRRLLATTANSIENLTGVAVSAVQGLASSPDVATFTSANSAAVATDYSATINWGDGTATTAGTIMKDSSGVFHVSGTHDYTGVGSFTPVVTIADSNGTVDATGAFYQTNLVSSVSGNAAIQDANLIDPWGLYSNSPYTWASDEGSSLATEYDLTGPTTESTTVTIPSGHPTGIIYNSNPAIDVSPSTPAQFLFATLGGTIAGWASGGSATTLATVAGAEFTGLASDSVTTGSSVLTTTNYLYATDFTGSTGAHGIDVFDPSFNSVTGTGGPFNGKFSDPNLPAGFEPFSILGQYGSQGALIVAYARPSGTGSLTGTGGYIDEFDTSGNLIKTIVSDPAGTNLNGPWGMTTAPPQGFGTFNNDLLVGNFGGGSGTAPGGTITAINVTTDSIDGTIDGASGSPLVNAGLWGIQSNWRSLPVTYPQLPLSGDSLYVSAGIDSQAQGLLAQVWFAPAASATVVNLSPSNPQPTVIAIPGQLFAGPVAFFTDSDTSQTVSNFNATISWGDALPDSPGTIIPLSTPGLFEVVGAHIYSVGVTYHIGIELELNSSVGINIGNTAFVSDVPNTILSVTGKLDAGSSSEVSSTEEITDAGRPEFVGTTSRPDATISLYATASGSSTPIPIGTGTSDAAGAWSITANQPLTDGSYAITAAATDPTGQTLTGTATIVPDLVIDTVGPKVTGVSVDRKHRLIAVTFQDYGGSNNAAVGLDMASVADAVNYQLVATQHPQVRVGRLTVASVTTGTTAGTETVTLKVRGTTPLRGGRYALRIDSESAAHSSGIQDKAGNALDGEFSGTLPSGNGVPGGDFVARLSALASASLGGSPGLSITRARFGHAPTRVLRHRESPRLTIVASSRPVRVVWLSATATAPAPRV